MSTRILPLSELRPITLPAWTAIWALPIAGLVAGIILRGHAGPFWLWSNLDPDYWYLLDSLNILNLNWPVHIAHPGTPLQVLGALLIKLSHPFSSADEITNLVLKDPEPYLHLIHMALMVINTLALGFIGLCGYLVFNDRLVIVLLQLGPFISKLNIKWMTHVAPEPLLISTVLVLSGVALLALRPRQLEQNSDTYAVLFGLIAGFGMATKITSIGIYFLPVILLWNVRSIALYAIAGLISLFIFTLPAAGSYGDLIGHINNIAVGSQTLGEVKKPFIDWSEYPGQLVRISSRPAFFAVFFASLITIAYLAYHTRKRGERFPLIGKLLAGLCLVDVVQALIVAKHPSGHYMIPVLVMSTVGIALLYRQFVDLRVTRDLSPRPLQIFFTVACAALIVAQSMTMLKLDRQFKERTAVATGIDDSRFHKCARIYFWSAASRSYALQLGSEMVGNPFSDQLEKLQPANDFWFEITSAEFRDWHGARDIHEIVQHYPCIFARGMYAGSIEATFKSVLPSHLFSRQCTPKSGHETILTSGVDCQGNLE